MFFMYSAYTKVTARNEVRIPFFFFTAFIVIMRNHVECKIWIKYYYFVEVGKSKYKTGPKMSGP